MDELTEQAIKIIQEASYAARDGKLSSADLKVVKEKIGALRESAEEPELFDMIVEEPLAMLEEDVT